MVSLSKCVSLVISRWRGLISKCKGWSQLLTIMRVTTNTIMSKQQQKINKINKAMIDPNIKMANKLPLITLTLTITNK